MIFTELNASGYEYKSAFLNSEFENILSKIIICYKLMISDNVKVSDDENKIRDILYLNYLNDNSIRSKIGMNEYRFDRETQEDKTNGRTDIRVLTLNSFIDTSAYYIIECKRLDSVNIRGITGLNAKYIQNGIFRFVSGTYSTYYKTNGMIGFLVQSIDIHENIESINALINDSFPQVNVTRQLNNYAIVDGFDYSYYSTHSKNTEEIVIYHLMLDFSKNIQ
jgi:hypothetical protein